MLREQQLRLLEQRADRLSVGVADDGSPRRIGRSGGDVRAQQGQRVAPHHVVIG